MEIRFSHAKGLSTADGQPPRYFELAGKDKRFHQAQAKIVGERILLQSEQVSTPVYARYAWKPFLKPNLVNQHGLPASPFTTDDSFLDRN